MRTRKLLSLDRKYFFIPRRIPRTLALVISIICISGSALLGFRSRQNPFFSEKNSNQKSDFLSSPIFSSIAPPFLEKNKFSEKLLANYETRSDILPENSPGENAKPISFEFFGEKSKDAKSVFAKEAFNLMASDVISLQRRLPENRGLKCWTKPYDSSLPSASVVIVFYNEPLSSLLRTVWSVINRSRPENLLEVIMVDDASDRAELKAKLDEYVSSNFGGKVRILRAPVHKGLIQGKLAGARNATADVLVFLDSHCEVNVGWLEPLLTRIQENPKLIACPMVDTIHAEDLGYSPSANWATGLFTWSLYYKWGPQGMTAAEKKRVKDENFEPHRTPTFPGGLFAMNRNWFFEVGSYDEQMEGWGGENLEMSFRVWMCGGAIEFIPCSRVGHISRTHTYSIIDEDRNHAINSARLAEVWMDEYKNLFYIARPKMKNANIGNLSSRIALREHLQCHSFKWFLENVFAEKFIPNEHSKKFGQLQNDGTNSCLHTIHADEHSASPFSAQPCVMDPTERDYLLQLFSLSKEDELRREEWCIDAGTDSQEFSLQSFVCNPDSLRIWTYTADFQMRNGRTGLCLQAKSDGVALQPCTKQTNQQWQFKALLSSKKPEIKQIFVS